MSWFARSIANTLSISDDEDDAVSKINTKNNDQQQNNDTASSSSSPRGVKEDLSELTKTFTRQLWGVASFLAPPPDSNPREVDKSGQNSDPNESDSVGIAGIRSDFAEIGGKFRTGISKLSDNINVSEITKVASKFLQLEEEDDDGENIGSAAIGVSEQVVAFARDIAMHPETWLDFPLPENEEDEDFDMSYAQQEHALAVERLAPRLAALRIELCPEYMSEGQFWKIYFVLLHPRLDKEDALLLSTPQIMEARAFLSEELQNRKRATLDGKSGEATIQSKGSTSSQHEESLSVLSSDPPADVLQTTLALESASSSAIADSQTQKHPLTSTELPVIDKSATSTAAADSETEKHPIASTKVPVIDKSATSTAVADSETEKHAITSTEIPVIDKSATSTAVADSETEKHPITSTEIPIVDKSVTEEEQIKQNKDQNVHSASYNTWEKQDEDDTDDWLKEETSETGGASGTTIHIENDEDVSFSDLEEDDGDEPTSFNKASSTSDKDSRDWIELSKSSADSSKNTKESNDWLDVDDIDVA